MAETLIKVEGMSCNHCKMAVEKALKQVSGVEEVQVDLGKKEVVLKGSAARDRLAQAITEAGYEVID